MKDADGNELFSQSALTESTTYQYYFDVDGLAETTPQYSPLQIPLSGNHTITVDTVIPQISNKTFTTNLLIDRM